MSWILPDSNAAHCRYGMEFSHGLQEIRTSDYERESVGF
jgi:hypothetical protein